MSAPQPRFGPQTTTDQVLDGIDLSGRLALVTGASSGLGEETARALAAHGAALVLTARNMPKGEAVAAKIRESTGNPRVEVSELELGSLASVREFAKRFLAAHPRLDLLINNAGVMACPLDRTQDGFELQFGTNHLGHFLLTCLLAPALRAGAPGRVVNLSSGGHAFSDVDFEDPNFEKTDYDKFISYGQSKTANVLFTVELDRRLREDGVRAFAVHPGVIMTELARHMTPKDIESLMANAPEGGLSFKPIPAGAATTCYAAASPDLETVGGVYLEDCHIAEINDEPSKRFGVRSYAINRENALRLWELSEDLVGQHWSATA